MTTGRGFARDTSRIILSMDHAVWVPAQGRDDVPLMDVCAPRPASDFIPLPPAKNID
jgi:hypothetical protein